MSAFTEEALVSKLLDLNLSQQSIQTLSLWLIHHRKHHSYIVKSWWKELQATHKKKKLTFMFLANDVIQNSKKKGPEYGREFLKVLMKAFYHISECCASDKKTLNGLQRILLIWEERKIYDFKNINEFRSMIMKSSVARYENPIPNSDNSNDFSKVNLRADHIDLTTNTTGAIKEIQDPPEPEDLIQSLLKLENAPSSDVEIREQIANLPPDVTNLGILPKLESKDEVFTLSLQVVDAIHILHDYNSRLCREMEDRKKLSSMLKYFHTEQVALLGQAEERLKEYSTQLLNVQCAQGAIKNHMNNLPILAQYPNETNSLAPLPSVGDLFNGNTHEKD